MDKTSPVFIRIQNRVVNVSQIAYVDFLESGRAMIFMAGLTPEKQNIAIDPDETRRLKTIMDRLAGSANLPDQEPRR